MFQFGYAYNGNWSVHLYITHFKYKEFELCVQVFVWSQYNNWTEIVISKFNHSLSHSFIWVSFVINALDIFNIVISGKYN